MPIRLARLSLSSCLLVALATPALATDYYVDAVNGNNAAAGTSPATAWKTLTFAAANAAQGNAHTIHIAPGTYSPGTGETFPLQFRGQHVIGDGGPTNTIVDAGGATAVILILNSPSTPLPASVATLRGLTLQNAAQCIELTLYWGSVTTSFTDLVLHNGTTAGLGMAILEGGGANLHVLLSRVRAEGCSQGLFLAAGSGPITIAASDCAVVNNQMGFVFNVLASVSASFDRCVFRGNSGYGQYAIASGPIGPWGTGHMTASFTDCLFANNQNGFMAETGLLGTIASTLTRCTVVNNVGYGLVSGGGGNTAPTYALDSTLVWGNAIDIQAPVAPTSAFSKIGGADPLFRDPALGDFRVYFGSPLIDAGNPSTPVGSLDLNSVARSIDGDLDTLERADIGCFEFRPLDITTTGQRGTLLALEIFGPSAGSSTMRLSRGPLASPVMTQFGEFDLNLGSNFAWITFPTAPGPGTQFLRLIPTNPSFIGQTYSFQGLVTSSASPLGAAWSNAVSFTIVP